MRADPGRRIVGRSRSRRRPGIFNAEHAGRRACEVILIGGGIVPSFVGAALAGYCRDRFSIRAVDDQRIRAAAAQRHLHAPLFAITLAVITFSRLTIAVIVPTHSWRSACLYAASA